MKKMKNQMTNNVIGKSKWLTQNKKITDKESKNGWRKKMKIQMTDNVIGKSKWVN
jgi:hypothetical protein